ncbi:hypothetical protein GCM10023086_58290 [Streptomyces venetus]|uniref:Uncharacterized protein n=1 Tax=Streptomyces venetus TaxID=1701086 RepID=A0ABP8GSB3_9ACTN
MLVCLAVEGRRTAAEAAEPFAVRGLVGGLRDHCPDPTPSQMTADRPGRVRLIGQDHFRSGPGSADRPRPSQAGHDLVEGGGVPCLPGREDESERTAAAVRGEVDLRGQTAAGPSEGMMVRLAGWGPF